jgi:hypothetical protein
VHPAPVIPTRMPALIELRVTRGCPYMPLSSSMQWHVQSSRHDAEDTQRRLRRRLCSGLRATFRGNDKSSSQQVRWTLDKTVEQIAADKQCAGFHEKSFVDSNIMYHVVPDVQ